MSNAQRIAESLGGVKKTPEGYVCKCPCHEDRAASLSIKDSASGGVVLNCFAGCKWEDVKKELQSRGLISEKSSTTSSLNSPIKSSTRYNGAKFYVYRDLVGNPLCRKVKLPDKKMWFERWTGSEYKPGLEGMTVPLYNLTAVAAAATVYLCEGEKDAETLISVRNADGAGLLCATTNHAGAKSWAPHLTAQLAGKVVVIIPDNDDAGRKRVAIVSKALQGTVKELRVFVPDNVPEHGDITDWVNAGNDPLQIFPRSVVVEKRAASKHATRTEYFELFETVLRNPRRCIFNEKLMDFDTATNLWNPSINSLDIIKSEALALNETREAKFCMASVQPHFFAFENSKPLEFLVDIPEWDGQDRISAMAYLVKMRPTGVSVEAFSELLKEWCALVFERLHNPMIQNRILVLQGGQGIGKDTWTSMLVDGLGQFCVPLAVVKEDKDTYLNLHRGLIMKISEFDKTAKTEVSTLKDIITAPSTNLRAPYAKDSKVRLSRCSFISSANAENLLRDTTGNRRFLIFELESIQYAYAGWDHVKIREWQMQCLAEMVALSRDSYRASPEATREMREYIEKQTPTDAGDDILDNFTRKLRRNDPFTVGEVELAPNDDRVNSIVLELSKETGLRPRGIKTMLQHKIGIFRRIGDKRFWTWRVPMVEPGNSVNGAGIAEDTEPAQGEFNY